MGGAPSTIGGALLIGALPRLGSGDPRAVHAFLLAIGLDLFMNSRPFEGAVLGCAALSYLLSDRKLLLKHLVLPAAGTLACGLLFTGYYNWKVTGSALLWRFTRVYQAWLAARAHMQLVLVRYALNHSPNHEWVYNNADINHRKVVWAHEMDEASNARLIQYFSDREAWFARGTTRDQSASRLARVGLRV